MEKDQFDAILPIICNDLVQMIMEKENLSEMDAIKKLYISELYAALEEEKTKVWYYSTLMLYTLLKQEWETGVIEYPDV